jgi:hypothetical protein
LSISAVPVSDDDAGVGAFHAAFADVSRGAIGTATRFVSKPVSVSVAVSDASPGMSPRSAILRNCRGAISTVPLRSGARSKLATAFGICSCACSAAGNSTRIGASLSLRIVRSARNGAPARAAPPGTERMYSACAA